MFYLNTHQETVLLKSTERSCRLSILVSMSINILSFSYKYLIYTFAIVDLFGETKCMNLNDSGK